MPTTINDLPNELLTQIIQEVYRSTPSPVHIEIQTGKVPVTPNSHLCSCRTTREDLRAHSRDWKAITGVNSLWRSIGRPLYFSEKTFCFKALCHGGPTALSWQQKLGPQLSKIFSDRVEHVELHCTAYEYVGFGRKRLSEFAYMPRLKNLRVLLFWKKQPLGPQKAMRARTQLRLALNKENIGDEEKHVLERCGIRWGTTNVEVFEAKWFYEGDDEASRTPQGDQAGALDMAAAVAVPVAA